MTEATTIHCFERSGLGLAPFRCVGVVSIPSPSLAEHNPTAYNNAMAMLPRDIGVGSCQYCGMSIMHNFIIQSADNRRFVVGSDCVNRTGDAGLKKQVRGERLRVARERRAAVRNLRREEREAIWKREREDRAAAFRVEYAALINDAMPWMDRSHFVKDVMKRHLDGGFVSEKALAAVERTIAKMIEEEHFREISRHVGLVGKRQTFKVKVQRVNSFTRPSFGYPYGNETVWVATMRDEAGNAIVSKSTAFRPDEGQELTIKATIKAHSEFRGEQQTVVQRVKAQ